MPDPAVPSFKVSLRESSSRAMLELEPRYDVPLNGVKKDELYYNMTGYRGALPMLGGASFDPGEVGIRRFKNEIALLNREAAEAIAKAAADPVVVVAVLDTVDPDRVNLVIGPRAGGEATGLDDPARQAGSVPRRRWENQVALWGTERISPLLFRFEPPLPAAEPIVLEGLSDDSPAP